MMKIPNFFPRKKLRATTARRSMGIPDDMDYEEMSEPNMKLSRALLIVLVLHVVAVAGIIAFNTIKTRQVAMPLPAQAAAGSASSTATTTKEEKEPAAATSSSVSPSKHESAKTVRQPEKIIAKVGPKTDSTAKPAEKATASPAAGKTTYVVAKGDNPVKIAKKFKVPYDDLLAVNHIDDPHKLKIGQKLVIPTKTAPKAKKNDD